MILETLAIFGFMVLLFIVGAGLKALYNEIGRVHAVAKDYDDVVCKIWFRRSWFGKADERIESLAHRLYLMERKASNTQYTLSKHITDNKHTKTAKAIKIAKEQKKAVEEADLRCRGDVM